MSTKEKLSTKEKSHTKQKPPAKGKASPKDKIHPEKKVQKKCESRTESSDVKVESGDAKTGFDVSSETRSPKKKESEGLLFKKTGLPEKDELVVVKVKRILPHCVFLDLLEYDNKEGMLHISEIAPGWVKNIRAHLQENQQVICKTMSIDEEKGYIDLSLKRVSSGEKNAKMNEWKTEKKMTIILQIIGKKLKKENDTKKIARKIADEYGSLSEFFSEVSKRDISAVKKSGIPKEWEDEISKSIQEHMRSHRVKVTEVVDLKSFEPDGVERIKKLINDIEQHKDIEFTIHYLGTPRYQITVLASDYKKAEVAMDELISNISKLSEGLKIEFSKGK
jgi:translation initiation factor 2 subunit 1